MSELEAAVAQALAELDIDVAYAPDVRAMLDRPRDEWPACCGTLCEPCVLTLGRAVDRVRQLCPGAPRP